MQGGMRTAGFIAASAVAETRRSSVNMRANHFPSPVHNLMVVEELESENDAGRVKPERDQSKDEAGGVTDACHDH